MKRFLKGFAVLAAAATIMLGSSMDVAAAGVRDVFDAAYYADSYADLKTAFGYDETALYNHYITCGLKEGRCASPVLNVAQYRKNYEDLNQAFGDNWDAYVDHYMNFGIAEGRTSGVMSAADADRKAATDAAPGENPAASQTVQQPTDSQAPSDQVYNALIAQKELFPEGMSWTNDNFVTWQGGIYSGGTGCAAFAFALSDAAFGSAPARIHENYENIRVGDILRINNDTHSVIVLEVKESSVVVAEGNYNRSIHWGREIAKSKLPGEGNYITTRYPD